MSTATSRIVVRAAHSLDSEDFRRVPISKLAADQTLKFPIHADDGMLLLAEGSVITPRILDILRGRGYTRVLVHRMEPAAGVSVEPAGALTQVPEARPGASINLQNRVTRRLDLELLDIVKDFRLNGDDPMIKEIPRLGTVPYSATLAREIYTKHESFIGNLRDSVQQVTQSDPRGEEAADEVLKTYLALMVEDIDLFSSFASSPVQSHYPYRHSLHVAMLALAMGARAGLDEESMRNLGLGALLHDIGMLRVPKQVWASRGILSSQQQLDVMAHPIYAVETLGRVPSLSDTVRYIAYQVHERMNGQGYPRRIPGELIHPLSRIVGVADTYVALLSDRPHRQGVQPYRAVESIVRSVGTGLMDPTAVRLLLQAVSLYPVGSYLILSNGQLAKVIRTNPDRYDRPIVRMWPPRTAPTDDSGELVDLATLPDLRVTEAIASPTSSAA